ncbi:MAG: hypothetical protein HYU52_05925 [Acidobacteria bacterium]|nr:hypothetical protein [Acidobacteriota bacterium]
MKKTLIFCAVSLLAGVLLGGWGMHVIDGRAKQKAVEAAMEEVRTERDALARVTKMMELRLRIGKAAIEASRLNYGNARIEADQVFVAAETLQALVAGTPDEQELRLILSRKEQLLGDLAVGNPASAVALEQMFSASTAAATAR